MEWQIMAYDEVSSTNDVGKELSLKPPSKYFVVVAQSQTSGRGRRGRVWHSPKGNLFMSLVFPMELRHLNDMVFLVSLSLYESVMAFSPQAEVKLKWPNDVLINSHKISGILLEKGENEYIIAGIGVNLVSAPQIRDRLLYPAAPLKDFGIDVSCQDFLTTYLKIFDANFELWLEKGFSSIREKWLSHAIGLHQEIKVNLEKESKIGIFEGISENGALLLRQKEKIIPILAGDIFYKKEN